MSCTIPSDNETETGPAGVAAKGAGEDVGDGENGGAFVLPLALNGDALAGVAGGKVGGGCDCVVSGKMMLLKNSAAALAECLSRFDMLNTFAYAIVCTDNLIRFWITTCSLFCNLYCYDFYSNFARYFAPTTA